MLNRSRIISVGTVLALTPVASANAFIFGDDMDQARAMTPNGTSFEGELAREYRDFFLFEADEMYDWPDADYFAEKALAANKGMTNATVTSACAHLVDAIIFALLPADGSRRGEEYVGRRL